jgi:hypothetical protein
MHLLLNVTRSRDINRHSSGTSKCCAVCNAPP